MTGIRICRSFFPRWNARGSVKLAGAAASLEDIPHAKLYDKLIAETRTPVDLQRAKCVTDWSALHFTPVADIVKPQTEEEIREALAFARQHDFTVSIAGTRHSMGGQAIHKDAIFLDMRDFRGAKYNPETQTVTVRTGTNWLDLQYYLDKFGRSVKVKQASSPFTIGGTLGANAHGEDPRFGSIIHTVKSIKVMLADGKVVNASRAENSDLFSHAIGGYGLFGIILEAELETAPNEMLHQKYQTIPINKLPEYVKKEVIGNPDIQLFLAELSISPFSFLEQALVWRADKVEKTNTVNPLNPPDLSRLHVLAGRIPFLLALNHPLGKALLWGVEKYLQPLVSSPNLSRNEGMTMDYELNRIPAKDETQVIQEFFIPIDNYPDFIGKLKMICGKYNPNLVYASSRFVKKDETSALPYAKQDSLSVVLFRNEKFEPAVETRLDLFSREAAGAAVSCGGTFYLTYQLPYSKDEIQESYPEFDKFFEMKRKFDPKGIFVNSISDKYGRKK